MYTVCHPFSRRGRLRTRTNRKEHTKPITQFRGQRYCFFLNCARVMVIKRGLQHFFVARHRFMLCLYMVDTLPYSYQNKKLPDIRQAASCFKTTTIFIYLKFRQWYTCWPIDSKLSYVAPLGLALWMIPFYVGFHPTLIYVAPSGLSSDKQIWVNSYIITLNLFP